jgi:hypothetical protein
MLVNEVVIQLERRERLRLFLLGYVYGLIRAEVLGYDASDVHTVWVLILGEGEESERWLLTPAGRNGQLLEALTTFSFVGQDQERPAEYRHPIPYERVRAAVEERRQEDAESRVNEGTAGERVGYLRSFINVLDKNGKLHKTAMLAAAQIDRLAQEQDELQAKLVELQAAALDSDTRHNADLYSVFMLMLREEQDALKKVVWDQIQFLKE